MSTIKSSSEHLTLNADGASKDIILQNNGSTKVTVKSDGNVEMGGQLQVSGGALSAPSFSFVGDTNTGISRPTVDAVNIVTGGVERMRIDSAGRVTMPFQPAFCARGFNGYVALGTSAGIIKWDVADFNTGSHMDITTGVFTAPVGGVYSISFNSGYKDDPKYMVMNLYVNGVVHYTSWSENSENYDTQGGTVLVNFSANDTIYVRVGISTSYSLPHTSTQYSTFSGHLIG